MWKSSVERGRPQMKIWRIRIACWVPNATYTHSVCVIIIAFPLQHQRASVLRYTYIACLLKLSLRSHTRQLYVDTIPVVPSVHPWHSVSHKTVVTFSWNSLLEFFSRPRGGKDALQEIRTILLYRRINTISTRIFHTSWPISLEFDVKRLRPKFIHSD